MKLLIIEDHRDIADIIFDFFEMRGGYELDYASDGRQGLSLALSNHFDLIILDLMLPRLDGLSLCRELREQGVDTPVLMLTARGDNSDVISGFEQGADDYLVKPFDLRVLEARVQALYRRKTGKLALNTLRYGALQLDLVQRKFSREGQQKSLNQTLFTLLKMLMLSAPAPVQREQLIEAVWGQDEPDNDILRSHIYQLRLLIDKPFAAAYLQTVPKVGYQLLEPKG